MITQYIWDYCITHLDFCWSLLPLGGDRFQRSRNCIMNNACISACEEAGEWQQVLELLLDAQDAAVRC